MRKILLFLFLLSVIIPGSFIRAVECDEYYYGLGVAQDYAKAYECFKSGETPDFVMLALMHVNGEGVPVDLAKAEEILAKAESSPSSSAFKDIIEQRIKVPGKYKKVNYGDIAMTTREMNYWSYMQLRIEKQKKEDETAKISAGLSPEAVKELAVLKKYFEVLLEKDSGRVYLEHESGTIRSIAKSGFEGYLMERNQARIVAWLSDKKLTVSDKAAFDKADKELNEEYKKVLKNGKATHDTMAEYDKEDAKRWLTEYNTAVKEAQRAWIKYRDQWVKLGKLMKPEGFVDDASIATAVMTALTKERTEELTYDPVAPSGEGEVY